MLESLAPDALIGYLRSAAPEIQQMEYGMYWAPYAMYFHVDATAKILCLEIGGGQDLT